MSDRPKARIITTDRRQFPLSTQQHIELEMAMQDGKTFYRYDEVTLFNIPKDIARVEKIQYTEADATDAPQLPAGRRNFKHGEGYKKFQEARKKLAQKMSVRDREQV